MKYSILRRPRAESLPGFYVPQGAGGEGLSHNLFLSVRWVLASQTALLWAIAVEAEEVLDCSSTRLRKGESGGKKQESGSQEVIISSPTR